MKKILSAILALLVLATAAGCSAQAPGKQGDRQSISDQDPPLDQGPPLPYNQTVASVTPSFRELIREKEKENPDVVGWLQVPGTAIQGPILKNPQGDNDYYLTHDFYRKPDEDGVFCTDFRASFSGGLSRNIPLYGHNKTAEPDGELFATLKRFKDPDVAWANPYLFFSTQDADMAWEVFAVFDVHVNVCYNLPDLKGETFNRVMEVVRAASLYDYGVAVTDQDHILTVNCCTYSVPGEPYLPLDATNNYRFVVMAKLVAPTERKKDSATFSLRENPLPPSQMPTIYQWEN